MQLEKIDFKDKKPFHIKIQSINRYPIHWHEDTTEIILPISGSIEVKSNFEHLVINEGDFLFINNKSIHYIQSSDDAVVIIFYINLNYFEEQFPYIKNMFFRNSIYYDNPKSESEFDVETKEKFKTYFRNLLISLLLESMNHKFTAESLLDKLVHKLVYQMIYEFNWIQFMQKDGDFISSDLLDRYHRIVKYIDENYQSKISLDDIVSQEYISKTYFSHFWKNLSTFTFRERISYERVLKSEFLLFKNMTILEISDQCGFSDVKYYYGNFKKWYGCMPLEHRGKCILYETKGSNYKELEFSKVEEAFSNYMKEYFVFHNGGDRDMDFPTLIDKYLYLKYYHNIHNKIQSDTPKYLLLDPLKFSTINLDDSSIVFNWGTLDLLLNLIFDFEFKAQIKLSSDNIENGFTHHYISSFIESCISRYGIDAVQNWHFLINYRDSLMFDNHDPIEKVLTDKIGDVNISYFIEP